MAEFDAELWRSRAQSRYEKSLAAGVAKALANQKLAIDIVSIASIKKLIEWCVSRNLSVSFGKSDSGMYWEEDKTIRISGRLSPEKQVFFLLHESGHYLIGDKEKHERFGMGYPQTDPKIKKTFHHRCDIVDEELEAWHRGFKLGTRLHIPINKERFDELRTSMLKTYFKWALKLDGYKENDDDDCEETVA